jgi:Ca-activated chloride channel family protein
MDAFFRGDFEFRSGWRARERMRLVLAWVVGLVLMALALSGAERAGSPYFEVKGAASGVDALPLKSTEVDATLVGPIAEVRVRQTYTNDGAVPLEARYVFPGSTRAAVHAMTMTVGGRRIDAVIKEKGEARKTYEKAKNEGRTAALLEAARSNVFEMNVGHVLPGDVVTVELRYTEMIAPVDARYEWVFPTVVGPRYVGGIAEKAEARGQMPEDGEMGAENESRKLDVNGQPVEGEFAQTAVRKAGAGAVEEPVFALTVEIVAGVAVREVVCATHRVETRTEGGRTRVALPVSEDVQMNRGFILRYRLAGDEIASGLMVDEWKGEKFFMLTLQPPARVTPAFVPARDYVFVVDVSGSMHGFPLETAKKLMTELLMSLRESDSFNVLLFSGGNRVLAGEPVSATPEAIAAALAMLGRQQGGGSTELLPALKQALELPKRAGVARSVVVVTDGYVMVEAEAYALVREKLGEANLFSFGIGSAVNRELIERLARAGRAEAAVIEGPARVVAEAERFRKMIEAPVLTQVRTQFVDFAAREVFPEVQPDVLAARPLVVVGKFGGAAAGAISVKGFSGSGLWEGKVDVAGAVDLGVRGVLAQLWARERLEQLRDLHAVGDELAKRKEEIVALGLRYNLLTPYTSFVAVDTVVRKTAGDAAQKVDQPVALPEGMTAGEGVPTTPEPGTVTLMVVAALVVAWGVWREKGRGKNLKKDKA